MGFVQGARGQLILENTVDLVEKAQVRGVVYASSFAIKTTPKAGKFIDGTLLVGNKIPFKSWGNSDAFAFFSENLGNTGACLILADVNMYNGILSLVVKSAEPVEGFELRDFLKVKYNTEFFGNALRNITDGVLSPKGKELLDILFYNNIHLFDKFSSAFCASKMHDACVGGLLAHTYKMMSVVPFVINTYPNLFKQLDNSMTVSDAKDLLTIGVLLHDIGKLVELDEVGNYTDCGNCVTHRILGLDLLFESKDLIHRYYSEKFYRHLQAIIVQHHGDYEEKCRTLFARLVHIIDMFESSLTVLDDTMCDSTLAEIKNNGQTLVF